MEIIQILTLFMIMTASLGRVTSSPTEDASTRERSSANLDNEPIPAETDPYVAHLVEIMNAPEPWDHL